MRKGRDAGMKKSRDAGVKGWGGVGIRDIGCRDEERQGERVVGIRSSSDRAGLPSERRCGRCGGAGRWQQRPSAGPRCGGGAAGGVPEGRGGSAGIPATLAPPSSPPGLQRRVEEMPLVQPSRGHAHGSSPDTDTGGSGCAGCPFPQSSMAGNSRLRWRRALPGIFVGAGAVNSIFFFSLQSLPGPCESPALSVAFFRCSWIVRFPTPLQHPDGALPGGHGEPATAAARDSPPPDAGGHSFGRVGIHPFVTRALVPPVRCARHYGWLPCRT